MRSYKITANLMNKNNIADKTFQQYDYGNKIEFELLEGAQKIDLTGKTILTYWLKNGSTVPIEKSATVNSNGNIEVKTTQELLEASGELLMQILVSSNDEQARSQVFKFNVEKSLNGDNAIIEDPNYSSDLVTELIQLKNSVRAETIDKITSVETEVKAIDTKLDDSVKNQLQCSGISVTIKNTTTDAEMNDLFNKILSMCNSIMLILMIVPDGVNSTNFESVDQSVLDKIKNKTKALGITIEGIKVHIVTEWNDGNGSKGLITPNVGDEQEWFTNYETHIMKYAKFCNDNKIPRLCLCNESTSLTKNIDLLPYWKTIVDDIHLAYPSVLLSIAMNGAERRLALIRKMNNIANVVVYSPVPLFEVW